MGTGDLDLVWYVDAEGAGGEEGAQHELWLMDGGEVLARAGSGVLACALLRPPAVSAGAAAASP